MYNHHVIKLIIFSCLGYQEKKKKKGYLRIYVAVEYCSL